MVPIHVDNLPVVQGLTKDDAIVVGNSFESHFKDQGHCLDLHERDDIMIEG